MAFKLNNPPYVATAPVHEIDMEDGILGKADRNGSILINKNIKDPKQRQDVVNHEQIHINDIKSGLLYYDDENVYSRKSVNDKWQIHPRKNMKEGNKSLSWEQKAHKHS
tara:strand:- start:108 stop:434 length:327 start_codon:yes stop_codon:yes gene_type:complete